MNIKTIGLACITGLAFSVPVCLTLYAALAHNPVFVESEEKIPAIVKAANPVVVKAGQIWGYQDEGKDPFEKHHTRKHVVAVQKGYVKYYFVGQENYGEWAAESEPDWYFVQFAKLVKDAPNK